MNEIIQNSNKLSLIISTRNDPVGTLITVRAAMEQFKECSFGCEIVVVDNSDDEEKLKMFKDLIGPFTLNGDVIVHYQSFPCLFSARDKAVNLSTGEYILIVDSHCLFYKHTISKMVETAESITDLGILFGSMCYSVAHENDAFVDRNIETFLPIRKCAYSNELFQIPLRSMPMLMKRELFLDMEGYAPLSTHKLVWGGGDFLISLKPLIMGYDNWVITSVGCIHLGPFHDRGFFPKSFIRDASETHSRFIGMLTAAYVIGGESLLRIRASQIIRISDPDEVYRMSHSAVMYGENHRRELFSRAMYSYNDLCERFAVQGDRNLRTYDVLPSLFPKAKEINDNYDIKNLSSQNLTVDESTNWRSRMTVNQDRLNFKQSGARI